MLNRVCLIGRIVAVPELKTTAAGISVTTFRIAVDRDYVKKGGERQADFFDIVAWRSTAEFVCRNFTKGSLIALDGQLQSRQYQNKAGENRTVIEVQADSVSFTGERRERQVERQADDPIEYDPNEYHKPMAEQAAPGYQPKTDPYRENPTNAFPYQGTMYTADGDLPWE